MELDRLQRRVVEKTYPREWHVLKLEATATYEKMRASDTQTSEVESGPDLEELMEILRRWNSEIKKGFASVEVLSQNIIVQMVTWKEALGRKRQQTEASATPTVASQASVDSGASSQINQLLQVLLVSQIRQMAPPEAPPPVPLFPPQKTQLSPAPPPNSSPISSDTDPVELLAEFFEWLKLQPGFNTQQQVNILEETKVKMVEEQWSLDSLKLGKPDEGISQIIWEEYGFKIGLLVRIRAKISDFKR
ncbi:hypothetical protein M501DRAFT_1013911 [Patellaria atrata CBS 101060]|uniref:Uncharacterized protein n=1 Tax=Patellaria atrata CBS 101060 TaxID=1346257 RepID=A0A9P4VUZ0_9PEZI|nr:hypothetical protein M501DRAFT_1013911 [Patellaria atrata CBS 101060]